MIHSVIHAKKKIFLLLLLIFTLASPSLREGFAEGATPAAVPQDERPEAVQYAESKGVATVTYDEENTYTINTLIMFVCAILVIFMHAGFAMLESGLNSSKNTINILFKNLMTLSVGILLYFFIGFGLMYPGGDYEGKWFGFGGSGVSNDLEALDQTAIDAALAGDAAQDLRIIGDDKDAYVISALGDYNSSADFLFQVAFAATAATIVSGAVAGRMQFRSYLIFSAVITGIVYPVSGMWKWGAGWMDANHFQDFAGSILVHAVGGFSGLAAAMILGARIGRFNNEGKSTPIPGHNITFAALGVFILWVGWYGFNPGSQLTYSGVSNAGATLTIAVTTSLSAAAGAIVAMSVAWGLFGKPDVTMALNGALAGLVSITANCDRVTNLEAILIGAIGGILVVLGIIALEKIKVDDPVGAWPVHGLCGLWGGIATGVFGDIPADGMSRFEFIWVQTYCSLIIIAWAFVTMFLLFSILKSTNLLRVSKEEETSGLDITEHGMHAYET
ncbi:MAG: ammonium transporter [Planctomycetota bacterium]|nr:ammonium transporter [Planctomycetota bacterium]